MSPSLRLRVALAEADVLHFLGYPSGRRPAGALARRLDEALAEARRLVAARGAWQRLPLAAAGEVGLEPLPAAGLVIGLVTAGTALEARAAERLAAGDATGALLFDAAGSAAAEEAANRLSAAVVAELAAGESAAGRADELAEAAESAGEVSCRISPGYGAWPLAAQRALFQRLPAAELEIRLEESLLMTPRKSISFAMWIGSDARPLAGLAGCARCALVTCRYRRETRA